MATNAQAAWMADRIAELEQKLDELSPLCGACGVGRVERIAKPGRTHRIFDGSQAPIPEDLPIPTCNNCGVEFVDKATAYALSGLSAKAKLKSAGLTLRGSKLPSADGIPSVGPDPCPRCAGSSLYFQDRVPSSEELLTLGLTQCTKCPHRYHANVDYTDSPNRP